MDEGVVAVVVCGPEKRSWAGGRPWEGGYMSTESRTVLGTGGGGLFGSQDGYEYECEYEGEYECSPSDVVDIVSRN